MARRPANVPKNRFETPLAIAGSTTLILAGIAAVFDLWRTLGWLLMAMMLLCLVFLVLYTLIAIGNGWIIVIGHLGQVHHVQRFKAPIFFWLIVGLYSGVSFPAAWYLLGRVFGSE